MKTISRIRTSSLSTIVAVLLVLSSSMGLVFAEETVQTPAEDTAQIFEEAAVKTSGEATMEASGEEAPEAPVQITPETSMPEIAPEDSIKENSPDASVPFGRGHRTPLISRIASILNMKVEDVHAARLEGKSFTQIAEGKGVSEAQLVESLTKDLRTFLDAQVAQGGLTSQQAATTISKMEENLKLALSRTEVGPPEARPGLGRNIGGKNTGGKNMSRMQALHGRVGRGRHGSKGGFSRRLQAQPGGCPGMGFGFGQGQGQSRGQGQGRGQAQGICPFCKQPQESGGSAN